jgi:hydroxymethylpyrimidine pyrophosphatase-like HAD family hydrolase
LNHPHDPRASHPAAEPSPPPRPEAFPAAPPAGQSGAIQLVVTDLDGTLSDPTESIHPRSVAAVRAVVASGIPVLVATGRRPRTASWVLDPAGLAGPAIVLDGAIGRDLRDGRTFHQVAFTPAAARRVLGVFTAASLEPCLFVDHPTAELVIGPNPATHPGHLARNRAWAVTADLARVVETDPVLTFTVVGGDAARLAEIAVAVGDAGSASVTPDLVYGGSTLQVRPSGISKWSGVVAFCRERDLDPGRVLAVGDGANDVELLEAAQVACAVAGGHASALALADHVIGPPSAGGWVALLDLI